MKRTLYISVTHIKLNNLRKFSTILILYHQLHKTQQPINIFPHCVTTFEASAAAHHKSYIVRNNNQQNFIAHVQEEQITRPGNKRKAHYAFPRKINLSQKNRAYKNNN